jgi:hypothetical protein
MALTFQERVTEYKVIFCTKLKHKLGLDKKILLSFSNFTIFFL